MLDLYLRLILVRLHRFVLMNRFYAHALDLLLHKALTSLSPPVLLPRYGLSWKLFLLQQTSIASGVAFEILMLVNPLEWEGVV